MSRSSSGFIVVAILVLIVVDNDRDDDKRMTMIGTMIETTMDCPHSGSKPFKFFG